MESHLARYVFRLLSEGQTALFHRPYYGDRTERIHGKEDPGHSETILLSKVLTVVAVPAVGFIFYGRSSHQHYLQTQSGPVSFTGPGRRSRGRAAYHVGSQPVLVSRGTTRVKTLHLTTETSGAHH
jgi:hypothetical protein